MSRPLRLFTSESVTEGHPDKMADQISDAVLDEILKDDPDGRVACETLVTTGWAVVAGEITTSTYIDIPVVVRRTITDIGYTSSKIGFDGATCGVTVALQEQSPDIEEGVRHSHEERAGSGTDPLDAQGAGDQGMMFGYACRDNDDYMPMPIWLAHRFAQRLAEVRKAGVRIRLITDGDVAAAIATTKAETGIDLLLGIGGAPEGVLAAAALRCVGGEFQGRLAPRNNEEIERAKKMGVDDIKKKFSITELAAGDVMFAATGVTDGDYLRGVHFFPGGATTQSVVMRSKTKTIRVIEATHYFEHKPVY